MSLLAPWSPVTGFNDQVYVDSDFSPYEEWMEMTGEQKVLLRETSLDNEEPLVSMVTGFPKSAVVWGRTFAESLIDQKMVCGKRRNDTGSSTALMQLVHTWDQCPRRCLRLNNSTETLTLWRKDEKWNVWSLELVLKEHRPVSRPEAFRENFRTRNQGLNLL